MESFVSEFNTGLYLPCRSARCYCFVEGRHDRWVQLARKLGREQNRRCDLLVVRFTLSPQAP